jgi:hypothetical protein
MKAAEVDAVCMGDWYTRRRRSALGVGVCRFLNSRDWMGSFMTTAMLTGGESAKYVLCVYSRDIDKPKRPSSSDSSILIICAWQEKPTSYRFTAPAGC